jgi:hypothetical protein
MVARSRSRGLLETDFQTYLANTHKSYSITLTETSAPVTVTETSEYLRYVHSIRKCSPPQKQIPLLYFTQHTLTLASEPKQNMTSWRTVHALSRYPQYNSGVPKDAINETPQARPGLCVSINPTSPHPCPGCCRIATDGTRLFLKQNILPIRVPASKTCQLTARHREPEQHIEFVSGERICHTTAFYHRGNNERAEEIYCGNLLRCKQLGLVAIGKRWRVSDVAHLDIYLCINTLDSVRALFMLSLPPPHSPFLSPSPYTPSSLPPMSP